MFQVALDSRIFDRFISPKRSVLPNSFNISSLSVITQRICQYLNNNALGHLYVSLSVEKLVSWEMMGFKDSGRVQSSIENTRRKHSAKRASNICLFHSAGIRIRKTITKQVVQRYLPHLRGYFIYEIDNVDDVHGHYPKYLQNSPEHVEHFCYKRTPFCLEGDRQRRRWMPFPARFSKHSCR